MRFESISVADYITFSPGGPVLVGVRHGWYLPTLEPDHDVSVQLWAEYSIGQEDLSSTWTARWELGGTPLDETIVVSKRVGPLVLPAQQPSSVFWQAKHYIGIYQAVAPFKIRRWGRIDVRLRMLSSEPDGTATLDVVQVPSG